MHISIHAPVKGSTSHKPSKPHNSRYFNPRSREGIDDPIEYGLYLVLYFNPRSREGIDDLSEFYGDFTA